MPKFSVIIPVYNVEKYLEECLNSVINQTLKDIEIICINDGSTDNSLKILEEYAQKDDRFVILNQENQGQGIARNKAIDIAKGEYISFVDPDDWIELDALEKLYNYFKETNAEVIQFDYTKYIESSNKYRRNNIKANLLNKYNYDISKTNTYSCFDIKGEFYSFAGVMLWNKAYSTAYLRLNNIKCAPNGHGEDHLLALMAVLCTPKVYFLDESLYFYRIRFGSSIHAGSYGNLCVFDNVKLFRDFLIKKGIFDAFEKEYREYMFIHVKYHYHGMPIDGQEEYKRRAKEMLTKVEYSDFLAKTKKNNNTLLENIFSVKNKRICGTLCKCITILGVSFSFKTQKIER